MDQLSVGNIFDADLLLRM